MISTQSIESSHALYVLAAGEVFLYVLLIWMILVSRIRMQSWRLLRRYSPLLPVFVAYLYYVFNPIGFSAMTLQRAYLCLLFSVAHWVVVILLIDRNALRWSFSNREEKQQVLRALTWRDMLVLMAPALGIFILMWFALASVADMVNGI